MSDVLVVIPQPADPLAPPQLEALGTGKTLATQLGGQLSVALLGSGLDAAASEAAERGADRVFVADAAHLERFSGDTTVAAAAAASEASDAGVVIVARSENALELAPRLAQRVGGGVVMGVVELRTEGDALTPVASVFGGSAHAVYRFGGPGPNVVSIGPGVAEAPEREAGRSAERVALEVPAPAVERVRVVQPARQSGPRLEDAQTVVSGGRGLQAGENFNLVKELAEALGGMPGASRAIVDDGWADAAEQVGLTGKIVSPDLYVAAGISGASQHMMGCSTARVLVGINTDGDAPIFNYAKYGIVGDCLEILPELIKLARERRGG